MKVATMKVLHYVMYIHPIINLVQFDRLRPKHSRPQIDWHASSPLHYEVENRTLGGDPKEYEDFHDRYKASFKAENEADVMLELAKGHPDHKWVIMWKGYKMFMDYCRRSNYCCPDQFWHVYL
jgi:hypothetical protein